MCILIPSVERVANTCIFARSLPHGFQALIYQMDWFALDETAMILPLPVAQNGRGQAVRFHDLSAVPELFQQLNNLFPTPWFHLGATESDLTSTTILPVHDVGCFEASYAPTAGDLQRLDSRFRLRVDLFNVMPQYQQYGFAVFKLQSPALIRTSVRIHPIALSFVSAMPEQLFFPTVHIHDGKWHREAIFDHSLFCQPNSKQQSSLDMVSPTRPEHSSPPEFPGFQDPDGWQRAQGCVAENISLEQCQGLLDPNLPLYRRQLRGHHGNGDQIVSPVATPCELGGTVYSANQSIEVDVVVSWKAPFTSGNKAMLPANTLLLVKPNLPVGATAITAYPLSSKRFESVMIDDEAYRSRRYAGYHLAIDINTFRRHFHCHYSLPEDTRPVWPVFPATEEAIEGCLLGTAVGDALGLPYEGLSRRKLQKLSSQLSNYRLCFGKGMFSDDTEHTVMVAQALCKAQSSDAFGAALGKKLKRWFACLPAGIGFATLRACLKLWLGWPATKSGVFSAGNGPMMRSALIGVIKGADPNALKAWVRASTVIAH